MHLNKWWLAGLVVTCGLTASYGADDLAPTRPEMKETYRSTEGENGPTVAAGTDRARHCVRSIIGEQRSLARTVSSSLVAIVSCSRLGQYGAAPPIPASLRY